MKTPCHCAAFAPRGERRPRFMTMRWARLPATRTSKWDIKVGKTPSTSLRLAPWYSGARGRRFARNQLAALTSAGNSPLRCVKAFLPSLFYVRCKCDELDVVEKLNCDLSRQRRLVVQGRAISNGCTFAPPAIRGFDGSMCSRSSRFWTSARATKKASFRLLACRSATLKKASPK